MARGRQSPLFAKVCEIIDIRPRVSDFSGTSRSPFEFLGRVFTQDGNSSENILFFKIVGIVPMI